MHMQQSFIVLADRLSLLLFIHKLLECVGDALGSRLVKISMFDPIKDCACIASADSALRGSTSSAAHIATWQ